MDFFEVEIDLGAGNKQKFGVERRHDGNETSFLITHASAGKAEMGMDNERGCLAFKAGQGDFWNMVEEELASEIEAKDL